MKRSTLDERALHHLGGHLAVIHRRIQRADDAALARTPEHGFQLTSAQSRTVRTLSRLDRPVLMSELAAILDVVPRSATSIIDELEPLGLVTRTTDATDRRCVRVSVTDRGRELGPELRDMHGRAVASVLTELTDDEITILGELLHRVAHGPGDV